MSFEEFECLCEKCYFGVVWKLFFNSTHSCLLVLLLIGVCWSVGCDAFKT